MDAGRAPGRDAGRAAVPLPPTDPPRAGGARLGDGRDPLRVVRSRGPRSGRGLQGPVPAGRGRAGQRRGRRLDAPARPRRRSRRRLAPGRREPCRDRLRGGRRGPQPERRLPLHPLRARPRAFFAAPLRPAEPEGAFRVDPGGARRLGRGGQRRDRRGAGRGRRGRAGHLAFRRDAADSDVPVRVRGRPLPGRGGGAGGPPDADVPPRDGRREGGAQPGRDLRPARRRPRLARGLHGDSLSVRQVRLRARASLPVRRHGASRLDLLPRLEPHAGRVGDSGRVPSAGPASSPTRPPTCGSATSSP